MPVQLAVNVRASLHVSDQFAAQYIREIVSTRPLLVASQPTLDVISNWSLRFQTPYHSHKPLRFRS